MTKKEVCRMKEKVYAYLKSIPKGKVTTYGQIAAHLGNKHLARAVGNILHNNPDPGRFPCHRVVNGKGQVAANFAFGGGAAQRKLLEQEGIVFNEKGTVDLKKYGLRENKMINKLGFGFLHLPPKGEEYDWGAICRMVDAFMDGGGTFFDTCYTYLNGNSDRAIKECVAKRKPRNCFQLCEKLPGYLFQSYADCQKYFEAALDHCGVEWFDVLMLHYLNEKNYAIAEKYDEFRFLREKKVEGLAKRIGFSFHGSAVLLDKILTAHPEVDVVLIQLNYLDWESEGVQSRACYETCLRHGKKVIAMEPIKGGTIANIPEEAMAVLHAAHPDWTPADWALRFVQSLPEVEVCLSGMNDIAQVRANIRPFAPLTDREVAQLMKAGEIICSKTAIGCSGCGYCESHCPQGIPIPRYIKMYNEVSRYPGDGWKIKLSYRQIGESAGKASDCIACRSCEEHCPQNLRIADHMKTVAKQFEG